MDYILFIHGVNTREQGPTPAYAKDLIELIERRLLHSEPSQIITPIPIYWGDVNSEAENQLLDTFKDSPLWNQMWFREFRGKQLLQFCGDAALYISRYIGAKVISRIKEKALEGLKDYQPGDRLHLVTHSWGTIILFDLLFASRWNCKNVPGYDDVMAIRDVIYGIPGANPDPNTGIQLASIHTMGSPIAIFSLTDVKPGKDDTESTPSTSSSHDITPKLQQLLGNLQEKRKERNEGKLPWRNFIHPGDPIAYPLTKLMRSLVDGEEKHLDIQDIITHQPGLPNLLTKQISQTALALLLHGGDAHSSYWKSKEVAQLIVETISASSANRAGGHGELGVRSIPVKAY